MGRVMAVDLGSKRIGVATSDVTRTLASPYSVVARHGRDRAADHRHLAAIAREMEVEHCVIGLPLSLRGTDGPAAQSVRAEAEELRHAMAPVTVELFDERFTTVTAHQSMMERNMRADARRRVVDKVAAAVMLQHWLDAQVAKASGAADEPAGASSEVRR